MALAAYNAGQARIARAIQKNEKRGLPTDFWSLNLPSETRQYVPRMIALRESLKGAKDVAMAIYSVADEPYFAEVDIASQLDLAQAAEMANVPVDDIYQLKYHW